MTNTRFKVLIIMALVASISHQVYSQTGKVVIQVNGVNTKKGGELAVAFFSKGNFPKVGKHSFGTSKEVNAETMEVIFDQVPVGEYGIAIFQDIDRNKDLKTNFVGYPTEPMGFSNNARIRFGPPSFDDARIIVGNNKTLNLIVQLR